MYFKKCGTKNEDSAEFCKQCSCQLNAPQAGTEQAAPPPSNQSNAQPVVQGNVSQSVGMQDAPAKKAQRKKGVDQLLPFADVHGDYHIFHSMLPECSLGTGAKRRLAYGAKGQFFRRITYGKYRRRARPGELICP